MNTWCERQGQVEVGVIEHEGNTFIALGASVCGKYVTAYTKLRKGQVTLVTWCGDTMLACRSEVVQEFRDGSCAVLFSLTKGRFVIGYALGDDGMLFRGELLTDCTPGEARRQAVNLADYWAEIDATSESLDETD